MKVFFVLCFNRYRRSFLGGC